MQTGYLITRFVAPEKDPFDRLLPMFRELLLISSGNVEETLDWLREVDRQHRITDKDYTIEDFIEELFERGYLRQATPGSKGGAQATEKADRMMREAALEQIFGKLKRDTGGQHRSTGIGNKEEWQGSYHSYTFGDPLEDIDLSLSMQEAMRRTGSWQQMEEQDLRVRESESKSKVATVLLIDISHSMILYGEDRITPAKRVAMALAELVRRKYPGDHLEIVAFGNDAHRISIKDLPYLQVGPFHTNTVAGLEMALDILRRHRSANKQIFMITDGKPTCLKEGKAYYKNSFGLDEKILNRTLNLAEVCRRQSIPVTTFMVAQDPWLVEFVEEFTEINGGRAFFSDLEGLGSLVFRDFEKNRRKRL